MAGVGVGAERCDEGGADDEEAHQYWDDRVVGAQLVVSQSEEQWSEGVPSRNAAWTGPRILPNTLRTFLTAMSGVSAGPARALAEAFPWDRHGSVVDIGTAQGRLPVELARTHAHLTVGGFDPPCMTRSTTMTAAPTSPAC